jgi:hypothetical protein
MQKKSKYFLKKTASVILAFATVLWSCGFLFLSLAPPVQAAVTITTQPTELITSGQKAKASSADIAVAKFALATTTTEYLNSVSVIIATTTSSGMTGSHLATLKVWKDMNGSGTLDSSDDVATTTTSITIGPAPGALTTVSGFDQTATSSISSATTTNMFFITISTASSWTDSGTGGVADAFTVSMPATSGIKTSSGTTNAGNNALTGTNSLTADTTAPSAPNITSIASDNYINNSEKAAITAAGTAEANSSIAINLSDVGSAHTVSGSGTANGSGAFSITSINGTTLNDGVITPSITATDAAGNVSSASTTPTAVKDVVAPSGYTISIDQGLIDSNNKTAVSFTFAGAEVGTTYNYSFDDTDGTTSAVTGSGTIATATDQISSINLSSLTDGTITLTVYLTDTAANQGTDATDTVTKNRTETSGGGGGGGGDYSAPVISQVTASAGSNQAVISWSTNETSISWIAYGLTTSYGLEAKTTLYAVSHSLTLNNLSPKTTYHYQVKSKDSSGNIGYYADKTFTTLSASTTPTTPTTPATPNQPATPSASAPSSSILSSSLKEGYVVKSAADNALYLIAGNKKIAIPTMGVFNSAGLAVSSIKTVPASDVAAAASGVLVKSSDDNNVYLIKGDRKIVIPSAASFEAAGFKWGDIVSVAKKAKDAFATAALIKSTDSDNVYVISKGLIRHIPSMEVFNSYKYKPSDIVIVTPTELAMYGQAILFKATGDSKVYLLDNGQKKLIPSADLFVSKGLNWNNIVEVSKTELDTYSSGANVQ